MQLFFREDFMTMTCWKNRQVEPNCRRGKKSAESRELVGSGVFSIFSGTQSNMLQSLRSIGCADQPRLNTIPALKSLNICSMSYFVGSSPGSHFRILCVTWCCLEPTASSPPRATVPEKHMWCDRHDWCYMNKPLFLCRPPWSSKQVYILRERLFVSIAYVLPLDPVHIPLIQTCTTCTSPHPHHSHELRSLISKYIEWAGAYLMRGVQQGRTHRQVIFNRQFMWKIKFKQVVIKISS